MGPIRGSVSLIPNGGSSARIGPAGDSTVRQRSRAASCGCSRNSCTVFIRALAICAASRRANTSSAECVANGYARLEWSVLDWNPATEFYKALGAVPMDEWTVNRLTDEPLKALAAQA